VTHHVSEIIPEIERVVLLREGRILTDGSKSLVLTEERLSELFGVPIRLGKHDGYFHLY
jgi:iron complex transport system ATP-binding protein